jgi:proteasome lid subunit RPN8/RPN11
MSRAVRVFKSILAEISLHAEREPRKECCGLLAGCDGVITRTFPATNTAADTSKNYEIAPEELVATMREMRSHGLRLMGIYHSHPNGRGEPSPRDIECAYFSDVAYFIVSADTNHAAAVRAFSIRDGRVEELKIELE